MTDAAARKPSFAQRCRRGVAPFVQGFRELREQYPWLEPVRKALVTLLGVVIILVGIAISWVPGPGGFIAFFGIALLASEFRWVRKLTRQVETMGHRFYVKVMGSKPRWWYRAKRKMSANLAGEC